MIKIIRAGRLNSVQDMGRSGFRHLGICQSGALDRSALAIANLLVGNPQDAAAIEFTLGPCELVFTFDCRIALGGADFGATLDDRPLPPWWSVRARAGQTLKLNAARHGMRTYLAVAGGINSSTQLGSRATDLQAGFGGHRGRALTEGDGLSAGELPNPAAALHTAPSFGVRPPSWYRADDSEALAIRVIPGPEYALFTVAAQKTFWNSSWTLTPQSNRMGFRLSGPELKIKKGGDLLSHGVLPGVIQVPPAGQPIVLMADAQTTGGYPKIGVVIGADLAKLAQLRFNRTIQFVECDAAQAREELRQEALYLQQIETAMHWLRPAQ
jgi:biotin-dependent carboxylase-like uncharacterized protein